MIQCRLDVRYPMAVMSGSVPSQVTLSCHRRPGCYSTGVVDLAWNRALRCEAWLPPTLDRYILTTPSPHALYGSA